MKFWSKIRRVFSWIFLVLAPAACFYALENFTNNPFTDKTPLVQFWNILFYEMIFWLLFFLIGRIRPAILLGCLLFAAIGLANYFVVSFRSSPIVPWDLYSIRTAVSVASNYNYSFSAKAAGSVAAFAVLFVLGAFTCGQLPALKEKEREDRVALPKRCVFRLGQTAVLLLLLTVYVSALHQDGFVSWLGLDTALFVPNNMTKTNGFTTTFLMDLRYLSVDVPDGYDESEAEQLLDTYDENTSVSAEDLPNIIVIMDETFSDPAVLADFQTNQDYMPFIHSLQGGAENTITGWLNVSVKGGNTANTEYEFLTGNSMRFLPAGSIPYQQYIFGDVPSLTSWLKELGYATAAIHPYNSTGWNRNKVYPWFGFDNAYFISSFVNPERVRSYVDDKECFSKILELYEKKEDGTPLFTFAVTMQNHSGYTKDYDNFTVDVSVDGSNYRPLERYLSLMKITDSALENFIETLSASDEKTVVVFFGDHQPNDEIVEPIWKLAGKDSDSLSDEDSDLRYQVPYVIWANYDIEEASGLETSANYLAAEALEAAGVPLSSYQQYLSELSETLPVISTQRLTDASGNELNGEAEDASEKVSLYSRLAYYRLFDAGNN